MFEETQFGFKWGPLEVTRILSDERIGVVISVKSGLDEYEVRASPSGRRLQAIKRERAK